MSDTKVKLSFACGSCRKNLCARVDGHLLLSTTRITKVRTTCPSCDHTLVMLLPKKDVESKPEKFKITIKKPLTRNEKRNLPIGSGRQCKYCEFVWPASTHLGRFESYQSRCKLGKKACVDVCLK